MVMTTNERLELAYVETSGYRAGACNIGPMEIRRRQVGAAVALIGTIALAALLVLVDAPWILGLVLAIPLAGTIISIEQVRRRFCVAFGLSGLRNLGERGDLESVGDEADRRADRRTALEIILTGVVLGGVIAVLFSLIAL
jgi:hypothetical protein